MSADPAVEAAQSKVDDYDRQIMALTAEREKFMNEFGRCGRWLDGHSYRQCARLKGHSGECPR